MNSQEALSLIKDYISSWKNNDFNLIASSLHNQCTVIESHGPIYHGLNDIKSWFDFWLAADSKILKWDLTSYYFCHHETTAFIEWEFECISNNTTYPLSGISLIKFLDNKIIHIHEYRMTKAAFDWDRKRLVSD
ncbi:nuclear transport factor 2 family protein [Candidiatus Paracoxiella cheracis]|uniref:nuclear transport factor 2 family protein n=1 Tax=Candidiatus Paracoxiella cheracis TaxID=3405120 RepID=UPI003BF5EE54